MIKDLGDALVMLRCLYLPIAKFPGSIYSFTHFLISETKDTVSCSSLSTYDQRSHLFTVQQVHRSSLRDLLKAVTTHK